MDTFFENANRIFETASLADDVENNEFALMIRPDGGLHFVMETPFSLDAVAINAGAETAYRVSQSKDRVRVSGRSGGKNCVIEERRTESHARSMLRDQPLYRISSPLLTSCSSL